MVDLTRRKHPGYAPVVSMEYLCRMFGRIPAVNAVDHPDGECGNPFWMWILWNLDVCWWEDEERG